MTFGDLFQLNQMMESAMQQVSDVAVNTEILEVPVENEIIEIPGSALDHVGGGMVGLQF